MLDTDVTNLDTATNALIWFHRNNVLPPNTPNWITIAQNSLIMEYGYNNNLYGRVQFGRGQFELTHVTNTNNQLVPLTSYNHQGKNKTKADYIDALKCNDLNTNQKFVSAIIILTSESCRSQMVASAITALMESEVAFSDDVWGGLEFAFKNYRKTAEFLGYDIMAGGTPWTSLRADNYISYINSDKFTGDRETETKHINAVKDYIRTNG